MKYAISGTIIIITVVPPTFFLKIYFKYSFRNSFDYNVVNGLY